jgi:hypothetical protein
MLDPKEIKKVKDALGAPMAKLFTGCTHARRIQLEDDKTIYVPVGKKRADGTRERPEITGDLMTWHLIGTRPAGRVRVPYRMGIYALIPPDECCFVAADIDNHEGDGDIRVLVETVWQVVVAAKRYGITVYLEVSSGGGGTHLWVFFAERVKANKARRLLYRLIVAAGLEQMVLHGFTGGGNFDRLFPAQEELAPGQIGNLIAGPYNGISLWKQGRSAILDLGESGKLPANGSWPIVLPGHFVKQVVRHTAAEVDDALLTLLVDGFDQDPPGRSAKRAKKHKSKKGKGKQAKGGKSSVDWLKFLDDNNIDYEIVSDHSAVLDECPCCGDAQKAWINRQTGWLNCWHNTCDATEEKGMPPEKWCEQLGIKPPRKRKRRK